MDVHTLYVCGELACFTRPELKTERLSYPAPTPSAARAIFDAIYWKRQANFYWQVEQIEILKPPHYIALRRNEVKDKVSADAVGKWMRGTDLPVPIFADGDKDTLGTDRRGRTQRQTMALKDVAYRIRARIVLREGSQKAIEEIVPQFKRRARAGQCIYQPYFGCREFPAYFHYVEEDEEPEARADVNADLGFMLYDVFDLSHQAGSNAKPAISLFHARIDHGVLRVPDYHSPDVLKAVEVM